MRSPRLTFLDAKLTASLGIIAIVWLAILRNVLKLNLDKLSKPISDGDLLWTYAYQDSFWRWHGFLNYHYGFPFGQNLGLFPTFDVLPSAVIGFFFQIAKNSIAATNIYFAFSFLAAGLITLYVASQLRLSRGSALFVSIAVMSLPWLPGRIYHSEYYLYSIGMLALLVRVEFDRTRKWYFYSTIGILTAICGPYIAMFSLLIVAANLLFDSTRKATKKRKDFNLYLHFLISHFLALAMSFALFTHSANFTLSKQLSRNISDSVHYGGYGFLLFTPLPWSPLPQLGALFSRIGDVPYSADTTSYSNFGSLLLLALPFFILFVYLFRMKNFIREDASRTLSILLFLFLFFTKGGLGPFVAEGISPAFRAWNRIAPYLQVLIFLLGAFCFQAITGKIAKKLLIFSGIVLLIIQIGSLSILAPKSDIKSIKVDTETVKGIQKVLQAGCGVLQLPLLDYPEGGGLGKMQPYDHLRLPLLDAKLNWSFGYSRESKSEELFKTIARGDYSDLKKSGFCGISVFKPGDTQVSIEKELRSRKNLRVEINNNRYIFFSILN